MVFPYDAVHVDFTLTGRRAPALPRLADRHVARLVKTTAMAAGVRGDLTEGEREKRFSGHSLRAGLASSAEVDESYVQKQLGHASAEMTRRRNGAQQNHIFRVGALSALTSPPPW